MSKKRRERVKDGEKKVYRSIEERVRKFFSSEKIKDKRSGRG